jgi:hypothetical protein
MQSNGPQRQPDEAISPHDTAPEYSLSEVNSPAQALAAIAPRLKEAALRLATVLAAEADEKHKSVRISTRELERKTGLASSALNRAISELTAPGPNYVTIRRGTATTPNAYLVNFLRTVRGASFGEAPPATRKEAQAPLFEQQGASFTEAPPAHSEGLNATSAGSDFDGALLRLIDQILSAKPTKADSENLATFTSWLHGYMQKFGRDENNRPLQNPHPPQPDLVAQFLAIAEPRRLGTMLDSLACDRKTCYSYGWFIAVAMQRIHGISWKATQAIRAQLRDVKKPRPPEPEQQSFQDAIAEMAQAKKMRR